MSAHEKSSSKQRPAFRFPFGRQTNIQLLRNRQRATKPPHAFPMLGEPPCAAGFLLYPGKREKMATTTGTAFGHKTCPRVHPPQILQCSLTLEGDQSFSTTNKEDYPSYTIDGAAVTWQSKAPVRNQRTAQEQRSSLYQQDFPAPKRIYVRRNRIVPHPDNLAINTSMRAEYRTVQREAFPGWDVCVFDRPVPVLRNKMVETE